MSIVDSGVVFHKLRPPEDLGNPVDGKPLSEAVQYLFDHTGFSGELLKVLNYILELSKLYESQEGQIVAEHVEDIPIERRRNLPQAERSAANPHGLQLPRDIDPFHDGTTRSDRYLNATPRVTPDGFPIVFVKPGLDANPDPTFDPNQPVIVVESGASVTDPKLAAEIERQNKMNPAERFKLPTTPPVPHAQTELGKIITPEEDDPF